MVLKVGDGRLKVGFEGRWVGKVVEEVRAMMLEVGERLLEVELRGLSKFGVFGIHFLEKGNGCGQVQGEIECERRSDEGQEEGEEKRGFG